MQKLYKKLSYVLLTAVMMCLLIGSSAAAEFYYDQSPIFYLEGTGKYAKGTGTIGAYETGSGSCSVVRSSLKSSVPSVASLKSFYFGSNKNSEEIFKSKAADNGSRQYYINLNLKKAGKTKVSFQAGKKKYTSTVTVLSYKNPLALVKLSGVKSGSNTNLAGLLKNKNYATVKMSSTQKKAVLTLKATSGWTISYITYENAKRGLNYSVSEEGNSAELTLGYFPTGSNAKLRIVMRNNKNFGLIDCVYTIK